jgi:hypothetical protein
MSKKFTVLITLMMMLCLGTTVSTADDPTVGTINPATSIIGEEDGDSIGTGGIRVLPSGNLVIASPNWSGNRGAVTCLTPAEYQTGGVVVTATNSLVGGAVDNRVGISVTILSNGDYVVVSPQWDDGSNTNVGALTWVNGDTCIPFNESTRNATVSAANSMVGSTTNDGASLKVYALPNGRYVGAFPEWDNGGTSNVGAVRWCGMTGCGGVLSSTNALVGSIATDRVGTTGVAILSDGDYVVQSRFWNTGRGAATWCKGTTGCTGTISTSNSLVGSTEGDWIGSAVTALPLNGNYVAHATWWDNGLNTDVGATTWCSGATGCVGEVSPANSLIGSTSQDMNGSSGAIALANGNYIMRYPSWDNGATYNVGAVVWCNGTTGCKGVVSPSNALVGSTAGDIWGDQIYLLTNGNFVVTSPFWDNGGLVNTGAAVWCSGTTGCKGVVSTSNALYGSTANDELGFRGVPLSNGNFAIATNKWDNPDTSTVDVGAVTFMNGTTGLVGPISTTNSLVGTQANDKVGSNIYQLTNGNYVVISVEWNNGAITRAGAATWINGATGFQGTVNTANSLVGGFNDALIGNAGVTALSNGNYVVRSMGWGYGSLTYYGAITWGDGKTGTIGTVDQTNSVVGSHPGDQLGLHGITALPNGHYLIQATWWSKGGTTPYSGAIRWANGEIPTSGEINATNSIVGSAIGDEVGQVFLLPNGDFIVYAQGWDNGGITNAGAIRRGSSTAPTIGAMDNSNALLGTSVNELTGAAFIIRPDNSFFISIPNWDNATGVVVYSPGPENLLKNPSFETAGSPAKFALNWKTSLSATGADKRLCDKPAKPITRTAGSCVFQFNSANTPLKGRTVKQIINNPVWGTVGNVLTLTADIEGLKVTGGTRKIILNVKYDNNTTDRATLTIPAGTYDYQTLVGTVKLTRTVKKVAITLNPGTAKGRIRVDNLFLSVSPAPTLRFPTLGENTTRDGASTFELPAAPDGFRH